MFDFSFDVCIIGDSSVGKTTFSYLLTTGKFINLFLQLV